MTTDPIVTRLVNRRRALGLSQRAVARLAGIANGTLSELERGQHSPTLTILRPWATALTLDLALIDLEPRP